VYIISFSSSVTRLQDGKVGDDVDGRGTGHVRAPLRPDRRHQSVGGWKARYMLSSSWSTYIRDCMFHVSQA